MCASWARRELDSQRIQYGYQSALAGLAVHYHYDSRVWHWMEFLWTARPELGRVRQQIPFWRFYCQTSVYAGSNGYNTGPLRLILRVVPRTTTNQFKLLRLAMWRAADYKLPDANLFTNGAWYRSPYLGPDATQRATDAGVPTPVPEPLMRSTAQHPVGHDLRKSPSAKPASLHVHSHTSGNHTNNIFPRGMLMMMLVIPGIVIDESN